MHRRNETIGLHALELSCVPIWIPGSLGESIADRQLATFERIPNQAEVCEVGLWRSWRHPNYFFCLDDLHRVGDVWSKLDIGLDRTGDARPYAAHVTEVKATEAAGERWLVSLSL
jgi:Protein of unknown function (DUF1295)